MLLLGFDVFSAVLTLIIIVFVIKKLFNDELAKAVNKIPGPKTYPLVGNLFVFSIPEEEFLNKIIKLKKEFGPIFRIWMGLRPVVVLTGAEEIEILIKSNKSGVKGFSYDFLHPWLGRGLVTSYGEKWALHRKLITPTFHFTILQSFIEVFEENVNILIKKLEEKADTEKEFDVSSFVTLCLLDNICETAMGTKINAQLESDNEYVKSVQKLGSIFFYRLQRMWLHPDFLFNLSPTGREFQRNIKVVHSFAESVIKARKEEFKNGNSGSVQNGEKKRHTFLDLLLKESMSENNSLLSDTELREEVDTFMFGGHDTTATSINWVIFVLSHYPKIQEEVYDEVKTIFDSKQEDGLTMADLLEMKLLERVIKETMRLFPSIAAIGRTVTEDVSIGPYVVPKGINTIINFYVLHRDPLHFENPEVFNPDRFLPENSTKRHPYAYLPFSAGPRNCIGQKFAMCEEKTTLSNLIYKFRFEAVRKLEDVVKVPEIVLRSKNGIPVKIYKR